MIRWRNGRPIVEIHVTGKGKTHVKPSDHDMSPLPDGKRARSEWAKELETRALKARRELRPAEETCDSFAARWLEDFPRGEATARAYGRAARQFSKDFKDRTLRSILKPEARQWARKHPAYGVAVQAMYVDAIDEGVADQNPLAKHQKKRDRKGREDILVLTPQELDRLCELAREEHGQWGEEFAAMILWAAYTCMRPGEVFASRWSRLDQDEYDLETQFNSQLGKETDPKWGGVGEIYVDPRARQALDLFPRRLGDDLMFRTPTGKQFRLTSLAYYWKPVRRAFTRGLPGEHHLRRRLDQKRDDHLDFAELRHFGASYLLNVREKPPWVIAQQLRHKDGGALVMRLYGHPDRRKAMEILRRQETQQPSPVAELQPKEAGR